MIRPCRPDDNEGVLRVWAQASAVAHPFLSEAFLAEERHNIPHVYLPNAETWIWEADGEVAGFISLLGHEVEVFARNRLGRAFYAKMGFVPGHEKIHAETGFTILRLRLAAPHG